MSIVFLISLFIDHNFKSILLIILALNNPEYSIWFALVATIGSTLGGMFGYLIGYVSEEKLLKKGKEVKSETLGKMVMKKLKKLDKVAYIRFASVYLHFEGIKDFKELIKEV